MSNEANLGGQKVEAEDLSGASAGKSVLAVKIHTGAIGVDGGPSSPTNPLDVAQPALTDWDPSSFSVDTSPTQILETPMPGRKAVTIYADPSNSSTVWIGKTSGVTASPGPGRTFLRPGMSVDLDLGPSGVVWAIAESGTQLVGAIEAA